MIKVNKIINFKKLLVRKGQDYVPIDDPEFQNNLKLKSFISGLKDAQNFSNFTKLCKQVNITYLLIKINTFMKKIVINNSIYYLLYFIIPFYYLLSKYVNITYLLFYHEN